MSPILGWFVNSDNTSPWLPSTSSANPCRAFFGPDLDENARAGIVQCVQSLHELHGRGNLLREDVESSAERRRVPSDRTRRSHWPRLARAETASRRRSSVRRSGSLAGATIDVWKAWLTGKRNCVEAGLLESLHRLLDGFACSADDRLTCRC